MKAIGVIRHSPRKVVNREEFEELLKSAGYEILAIVEQVREEHPKYNVGPGKLQEIKKLIAELNPDRIIFANPLTPSQSFNITKELKIDVIDKWQLVLEIFEQRAHSKEAKLQVELANLQYELPLVKEAIRRIKLGDRAGFKGMGEYQTQQYLKHIRYRMGRIRKELEKVKADREVKRKRREEVGFILVALAGYTNAGKSTLLNALADEEIEARMQMFTTLDTTTRRFTINGKRALVTDTVGFIDDLPPFIVEAFHSTLEEIIRADIVLLVLDVSEPWSEIKRKFLASIEVLKELKALDKPLIIALNKNDLTSKEDVQDKKKALKELIKRKGIVVHSIVSISAKKNDLNELQASLEEIMFTLPKYRLFEILIKDKEKVPKVMALINSIGEILDVKYGETTQIFAYIQVGMIKSLTRMGVELKHPS
ncbi:GTP-binding protein HflX [Thermococcus sp. EP1]|uniref:GTPase HflX n=1 Tax=Thermococcus sp. EP1 TaxID=1591054 RepID=UPI0006DA9BCD|nr:GTPase HflX [Thermococcus sp. EP1]KPU63501.1 GTP-binding protein HflX [Thermococcus sp. EP1]